MKKLDASEQSILGISWSTDGEWLTYSAGGEVRLANVETDEVRVIGQGCNPRIASNNRVIFEKEDELFIASGQGVKKLFSKNDLVKDTPKRAPIPSPDGEQMVFCVCNVYDKVSQSLNSYSYRHFLAKSSTSGGKAKLLKEQWYGGTVAWFADGKRFLHFEFDSTAGPQIHIVSANGEKEAHIAGIYPSISPDGNRIAARPRGGSAVVVYTSKGGWSDEDITTSVIRIQSNEVRRPSATPAVWLDNRLLLMLEGGSAYRVDTKKGKAEELKKFQLPTERRIPTMVSSPNRELLAMEVAVDGGFELRVGKP